MSNGEGIEEQQETEVIEDDDTATPITDLANEVLAGKWGKGAERRKRLTEAGYDPNDVQSEVTRLLNRR
jgi:N-acetylmuramoyl-L-alanine amidase